MAKTTNNEDEPKKSRKGLALLYRLTHYDSSLALDTAGFPR